MSNAVWDARLRDVTDMRRSYSALSVQHYQGNSNFWAALSLLLLLLSFVAKTAQKGRRQEIAATALFLLVQNYFLQMHEISF